MPAPDDIDGLLDRFRPTPFTPDTDPNALLAGGGATDVVDLTGNLEVEESDGSPSVEHVEKIVFDVDQFTVTDQGDGTVLVEGLELCRIGSIDSGEFVRASASGSDNPSVHNSILVDESNLLMLAFWGTAGNSGGGGDPAPVALSAHYDTDNHTGGEASQALSLLRADHGGADHDLEVWYLDNPGLSLPNTSGVSVISSDGRFALAVALYRDVTSNGIVSSGTATGTSSTPSVAVACEVGQRVVAAISYHAHTTIAEDAGWTERTWAAGTGTHKSGIQVIDKVAASTTETPAWTLGASAQWTIDYLVLGPAIGVDTPADLAQDGEATPGTVNDRRVSRCGHAHEHGSMSGAGPHHKASQVTVADVAGDFTATEVEGVLAELQSDAEADAAALAAHAAAADPHSYVLESLLDAKGDLIAASADNTPAKVTVGSNDTVLMAASGQATGVRWGLKHKLDATAAPTVNDDSGDGYEPGSVWVDVTNDKAYILLDATPTAAVWKETTAAPTGGTVTVEEEDGTPTGDFDTIKFPNGSVTDNGDGSVSVDPGGGSSPTFVGAKVYNNTTQSVNNTTDTKCAFNQELFDTDTFHDTATNNSRFTIGTGLAGKYLIGGMVTWDTNTTGSRNIRIMKNGSTSVRGSHNVTPANAVGPIQETQVIEDLAEADYVELNAFQTSGGTRTIGSSANDYQQNTFWLVKVG